MTIFNRQRRRRGNAIIEMAFMIIPLMAISFGCVEFGYFFFVKHTLQGASREGARAAAVRDSTNADVTTAVLNSMKAAGFESNEYTLKIRNATDTTNINVTQTAGTGIMVKVECNWSTVGVRPMGLIGPGKIVVGQTVMRKEG
jgi:Flp pilus assembly protein TadG